MINIIDEIEIPLKPVEKDRVIINLLIDNLAKNNIAIEQTVKLRLKLEYPENLTNEILQAELCKVNESYKQAQYEIIANILSNYSGKSENTNQSLEDKFNSFVEIFQSITIDLINQLPGKSS